MADTAGIVVSFSRPDLRRGKQSFVGSAPVSIGQRQPCDYSYTIGRGQCPRLRTCDTRSVEGAILLSTVSAFREGERNRAKR
jgi:hypothetical protein